MKVYLFFVLLLSGYLYASVPNGLAPPIEEENSFNADAQGELSFQEMLDLGLVDDSVLSFEKEDGDADPLRNISLPPMVANYTIAPIAPRGIMVELELQRLAVVISPNGVRIGASAPNLEPFRGIYDPVIRRFFELTPDFFPEGFRPQPTE